MLFSLPDIGDSFDSLLTRWFSVSEQLDSVCNLVFSIRFAPPTYLEHGFINTVQALESYHRRRFNNQVLSTEEFRRRLRAITESVPHDLKSWLKQKLGRANEPSLRERLEELVDHVGEIAEPLIGDKHEFAKSVADNRNYRTHFDKSLKKRVSTPPALRRITDVLTVLIEACLLMEMGMDRDLMLRLFQRNQRYAWLVIRSPRDDGLTL
jgi:hypothetical protein